ncbi:YacL family protein [Gallibacterium melopsittaci]|uniref:YacL family protein n=1 Tax=Gallibacterium melopsittaci TaxID=516063 RepID=A0ABV6HYA7_9PAST
MEFQFYRIDRQTVNVSCSMEHEAVARWANSEIQGNLAKIEQILMAIEQSRTQPHTIDKIISGKEFSLHINADEIMVKANILFDESSSDEILEDDLQFYDEENIALCGVEDFIHFLNAYAQFIQE